MSKFFTKDKKVRPLTQRGLYHKPRYKKYSQILSNIHNTDDARIATFTLHEEFDSAERAKKVRIKRALVQRANRARVASQNANLSPKVRSRELEIADIFEKAYKQMDIPSKNGKNLVLLSACIVTPLPVEQMPRPH